jgi:hypothetical protein
MIVSPRSICAGAWLFGLLFGLTLLLQLTQGVDLGALWQQSARVPAWTWLAAAAAWHSATLVQAWRLQRTWHSVQALPLGRCWSLTVHHGLVTRLLPLRLGDISHAWMVHREWRVSLGRAASSLYWMRWQDVTTLAALALLMLAPLPVAGRFALFALVLLLGSVLLPQQLKRMTRGRSGWQRWNLGVAEHGRHVDGWVASGCMAALRLLAVALLLQPLNPTQAGALWHTTLGIELSAWLPVQGPAGLGTYEAGAWLGSRLGGVESSSFVAAALVAHAFGLVLAATAALAAHLGAVESTPHVQAAT